MSNVRTEACAIRVSTVAGIFKISGGGVSFGSSTVDCVRVWIGGDNSMVDDEVSSGISVRLVVSKGGSKGKVFPIEEGTNLLGRWDPETGAFPEVDLEDEDVEAKVSRKHAVISRRGTEVTIEDVGSLNGTFVNRGAKLEQGQAIRLKAGDEVIIGKIFLKLEVEDLTGQAPQRSTA